MWLFVSNVDVKQVATTMFSVTCTAKISGDSLLRLHSIIATFVAIAITFSAPVKVIGNCSWLAELAVLQIMLHEGSEMH